MANAVDPESSRAAANLLNAERKIMSVISAEGRQLRIVDEFGLEQARRAVRQLAEAVKLPVHRRVCLLSAARELADNLLRHGGGGSLDVAVIARNGHSGVRCVFSDHGPGIVEPERLMHAAETAGFGRGQGLAAARSLVDEFRIQSAADTGTWVEIVMWDSAHDRGIAGA
jgi:serine/threonine-protein kinase RsbT